MVGLNCGGFLPEQYEFFAIGTLERAEAAEIAAHVEQSCETCTAELARSMRFWGVFAAATAGENEAAPVRDAIQFLPLSIRSAAEPIPIRVTARKPQPSWWRWTAAAAAVAALSVLGTWYLVRNQKTGVPAVPQQTAELERRVAQLSEERDRLVRQRDQAATTTAPPIAQPNTELERTLAARSGELQVAQRAVAELRQQFENSEQALREARLRTTQLESELTDQQTKLVAAQRDQARAVAQLTEAAEVRRRAEAQVETLRVQVQQLTQQRTELLQAVQLREQQSNESLRMISLLASPATKLIHVLGTESAPQARGYALLTADNHVLFFANGLPALPAGRDYQLWLIRGKSPAVVSGGTFRASAGAFSRVEFGNAALATDIRGIAVTDEPAGGSAKPTGHKFLAGTGRS